MPMRPQFDDRLKLADGGRTVEALGPIELTGDESELYIWVQISQGEGAERVTAQAHGEREKKDLEAQRAKATEKEGPKWELPVKLGDEAGEERVAPEKAFKPGKARAEAWTVALRENRPGTLHSIWWEEVELY
jgi:hypothetical protein